MYPRINNSVPSRRTKRLAGLFVDKITESPALHRNVQFYAAELNVSPKHLHRICKEVFAKRPILMIHTAIIEKAKKMLIETDVPLKEIADELGFKETTYFCRFFKKETGRLTKDVRNESTDVNFVSKIVKNVS